MTKLPIDELKGNRVHFIGIGGISMSGLAVILKERGYMVAGSDLTSTPITDDLKEKGIKVFIGHNASYLGDADWVVYTIAVKGDNPEIMAAKERGLPIIERASLLGRIMSTYPYSIGVSGSHGKTTATSILSMMLMKAKLDPTALIGGQVDELGGNVRVGKSRYFITEACEYNGSFLHFNPYLAIILNMDEDHLDYYKDMESIYKAFLDFSHRTPQNGLVIGCGDDPLVKKLMKETQRRVISFSVDGQGDWMARDIKYDSLGHPSYRAVYRGQDMGRVHLNVPGKYNIYNALAASAAAWAIGVSGDIIRDSLASFKGTHRRFEIKGAHRDVTVIDDYAHHPTEIRATLNAAQNYPHKKLWCVFQPHTYTRTEKLFYEFSAAFLNADEVIVTDIYAAREKPIEGIHSEKLANAIGDKGQPSRYMSTFDDTVAFLRKNAGPGDIILTMGAGDVFKVGDKFLKEQYPENPESE